MFIPIMGATTRLSIVAIFGLICISLELDIKFLFSIIALGMSSVGLILFINMFGPVWNPNKNT